ncbi:hypothetical protein ISCGN_027823 [Ixodes scapularis]
MLNKVKLLLLVTLLTTSAALEDGYVCDLREYDQLIMDCRNEVGETHEFVLPTEEEKNMTDIHREMAECKNETEKKLAPETFCKEPYFLTLGTCYLGKDDLKTGIVYKSGINQELPLHEVFMMFQDCVTARANLVHKDELEDCDPN